MLRIQAVEEGSLGEEMGLARGDNILSINSHQINDSIDYAYHITNGLDESDLFQLEVKKGDGQLVEIEAELEYGDDLGLDFPPLKAKSCKNNCIFCFVHQLPKGLRRSLYVTDEDFRLSFLLGNYVTLSKVDKADIERIQEQKLSPLYISVHSTDEKIRETLLGMKPKWAILDLMADLASAGIKMHAQIVVCPEINDGESLKESIQDLYSLYPSVSSLAVVPVGLTTHREKLPHIKAVSREDAVKTINEVKQLQKQFRKAQGSSFVFLADEYYLKADLEIPLYDHYEDFPQLENGVGLLASFKKNGEELFRRLTHKERLSPISVVTGKSPLKYINEFTNKLIHEFGMNIKLFPISNELLGETVTVTGLISGGDIVRQLKGQELGEKLFIPNIAMRDGNDMFIDDLTLGDIKKELGVEVIAFDSSPSGFVEAVLEG